jgi:prepilin-type N-terminal cleavage/methylation domain-containing protein
MRQGFSLVEILVVIGVMAVMIISGLFFYSNLQLSTQLDENTNQIVQTLRTAREYSVAGYNSSPYGVYFLVTGIPDQYVLYQGKSYASRNASYDRLATMDRALSASSTSLSLTGGNIDINFAQGTGTPSNIGTLVVSHSAGGSRAININRFGLIELN